MGIGLGDFGPDIHGGLGHLHHPARLVQPLGQHVAAQFVGLAHFFHTVLGAVQGDHRGHLDRREGAVVVVALDAGQGGAQLLVADHVADAPAGHVVALGHGEEFHRHVPGAGHFHDGGGPVAVEDDVGVGQVMHHQDVVLLGQGHHPLEEVELDAARRGIAGEAQDHHLGLGRAFQDGPLQFFEEIHIVGHAHGAGVGPGDDGAVDVDGVAGIGHQHRVAPVQGGEHEVGQAFLGADGDHRLAVRVEFHVVAAQVPVADGLAQPGNALGNGIAVGVAALGGVHHLVHDVFRRGAVRVAHGHVDDVLAPTAGSHLQLAGDVEHIGRQTLDAGKVFHGRRGIPAVGTSGRTVRTGA